MKRSVGEETFDLHVRAEKLPPPEREYRFDSMRRFRFDFAWPDRMLAVEIEGGVYTNGRHTRGSGFAKDAEKYNLAALQGWRVLRFPTQDVLSGHAVALVRQAVGL